MLNGFLKGVMARRASARAPDGDLGLKQAADELARDTMMEDRAADHTSVASNSRMYEKAIKRASWKGLRGGLPSGFAMPDIAGLGTRLGSAMPKLALPAPGKRFGMKSAIAGGLAIAATAAIAFPALVDATAGSGFRMLPETSVSEQAMENADCAEYVAYMDRGGDILDHSPSSDPCASPYGTIAVDLETALRQSFAMAAVEGRFEGPGRVLSLDLAGLARAARALGRVGGTTPEQTTMEYALGFFDGPWHEKLAITFYHAPIFVAHHLPTVEDRIQFAVSHMGCARGIAGAGPTIRPSAGHLCAALVGETSLTHLSWAERCLIEGSRRSQVRVPGPRASRDLVEATYHRDWRLARDRAARLCLPRLLEGIALERALDDLAALEIPDLTWLRAHMRGRSDALPGATSLHAVMLPEGGITPLEPAAQRALQSEVWTQVDALDLDLDNGLCAPGAEPCADEDMLDIAIAVVPLDDIPQPAAVFQSRANLLTTVNNPLRSQASLVKSLLIPLFLHHGIEHLCRETVPGLQDAGGYQGRDCATNGEALSLGQALAISSNLAFHQGLDQISDDDLRAFLTTLGFRGQHDLSGGRLRRGLLIGDLVTISTDALLASYGTLVSGVAMAGPFGTDPLNATPVPVDSYFGPDVITRSQAILRTPGTHPLGTARGAYALATAEGCSLHQTKTGTGDGDAGRARDRLFMGVLTCGNRSAMVYGMVGSPDPGRDLQGAISSWQVNDLVVSAGIAALRAMPAPPPPSTRPLLRPDAIRAVPSGATSAPVSLLAPIASTRPTPRVAGVTSTYSSSN